jgi:hypothetical protein
VHGYLLKRPVGRPTNEVRRYYANFTYRAASWSKPRRVIAKVEWHPGEQEIATEIVDAIGRVLFRNALPRVADTALAAAAD